MKIKLIDKHYLYQRDDQTCRFCGRALKFGKKSIDHYLPRSHGGTDDVFNLVISCKSCNCMKKSSIPPDVEQVHIALFTQAVKDRKVICKSHLRVTPTELESYTINIVRSYASGEFTVFESPDIRFYVKENLVHQITHLHKNPLTDDDWI